MKKEKNYTVEINVDYDAGPEKRFLMIRTTDDDRTVGENVARAAEVLNKSFCNEYDSYEEYFAEYSECDPVTKEEFETMEGCFDGYNEDTFGSYLQERYGYKTMQVSKGCDFEVTI